MLVEFWICDRGKFRVRQAPNNRTPHLEDTIPLEEFREMCDRRAYSCTTSATVLIHNASTPARAYNFYTYYARRPFSNHYFEGRQFSPEALMAATEGWREFIDELNALARERATAAGITAASSYATTSDIFNLVEDMTSGVMIPIAPTIRVQFLGVTYELGADGPVLVDDCSEQVPSIIAGLRETASGMQAEMRRIRGHYQTLMDSARAKIERVTAPLVLTGPLASKGFVVWQTVLGTWSVAKRIRGHKTGVVLSTGQYWPINEEYTAINDFAIVGELGGDRFANVRLKQYDDLNREFHNAHTSGDGGLCTGDVRMCLDLTRISDSVETILECLVVACAKINLDSLNSWGNMDSERIERQVISLAHRAGWPRSQSRQEADIRGGRISFIDPGAEQIRSWGNDD